MPGLCAGLYLVVLFWTTRTMESWLHGSHLWLRQALCDSHHTSCIHSGGSWEEDVFISGGRCIQDLGIGFMEILLWFRERAKPIFQEHKHRIWYGTLAVRPVSHPYKHKQMRQHPRARQSITLYFYRNIIILDRFRYLGSYKSLWRRQTLWVCF